MYLHSCLLDFYCATDWKTWESTCRSRAFNHWAANHRCIIFETFHTRRNSFSSSHFYRIIQSNVSLGESTIKWFIRVWCITFAERWTRPSICSPSHAKLFIIFIEQTFLLILIDRILGKETDQKCIPTISPHYSFYFISNILQTFLREILRAII